MLTNETMGWVLKQTQRITPDEDHQAKLCLWVLEAIHRQKYKSLFEAIQTRNSNNFRNALSRQISRIRSEEYHQYRTEILIDTEPTEPIYSKTYHPKTREEKNTLTAQLINLTHLPDIEVPPQLRENVSIARFELNKKQPQTKQRIQQTAKLYANPTHPQRTSHTNTSLTRTFSEFADQLINQLQTVAHTTTIKVK